MTLANLTTTADRSVSYRQPSWHQILRWPTLWTMGIVAAVAVLFLYPHVVWKTEIFVEETNPYSEFLVVSTGIITLTVFTLWCSALFWYDVYSTVFLPKVVQPVVLSASSWSLDDMFRILYDPSQLWSGIGASVALPVAMYMLPTTPEQRARVWLAATGWQPQTTARTTTPPVLTSQSPGFISTSTAAANCDRVDSADFWVAPGGWKQLLPESLQVFLENVVVEEKDTNANICDVSPLSEKSWTSTSTTTTTGDKNDKKWTFETSNHRHPPSYPTCTPPRRDRHRQQQDDARMQQQRQPTEDLSELVLSILRDLIHSQRDRLCVTLCSKQKNGIMVSTAAAAATLGLILQIRYSSTARSVIRTVAHSLALLGGTTATVGSIFAILVPYWMQHYKQQQQQQQHHVSSTFPRSHDDPQRSTTQRIPKNEPAGPAFGTVGDDALFSNTGRWTVPLASFFSAMAGVSGSVPQTPRLIPETLALSIFRYWKGVLAACVLAYFHQYCRRRRLHSETKFTI